MFGRRFRKKAIKDVTPKATLTYYDIFDSTKEYFKVGRFTEEGGGGGVIMSVVIGLLLILAIGQYLGIPFEFSGGGGGKRRKWNYGSLPSRRNKKAAKKKKKEQSNMMKGDEKVTATLENDLPNVYCFFGL